MTSKQRPSIASVCATTVTDVRTITGAWIETRSKASRAPCPSCWRKATRESSRSSVMAVNSTNRQRPKTAFATAASQSSRSWTNAPVAIPKFAAASTRPATLVASARPLALDGEAVLVASHNPVNTDDCNHRLEQIPPARRSPSQFHQTATAAHADHEQSESLRAAFERLAVALWRNRLTVRRSSAAPHGLGGTEGHAGAGSNRRGCPGPEFAVFSPLRQLRTAAPCRSERRLPGRIAPRDERADYARPYRAERAGRHAASRPCSPRVRGVSKLAAALLSCRSARIDICSRS